MDKVSMTDDEMRQVVVHGIRYLGKDETRQIIRRKLLHPDAMARCDCILCLLYDSWAGTPVSKADCDACPYMNGTFVRKGCHDVARYIWGVYKDTRKKDYTRMLKIFEEGVKK